MNLPQGTDESDIEAAPPAFMIPPSVPPAISGYLDADHDVLKQPGSLVVGLDGAANYVVPIEVPPGRLGQTPNLALRYNSNGPLGVIAQGWSIDGLRQIERCPRTIADDNVTRDVSFDNQDALCLDGSRLVAVQGALGAPGTVYRTWPDTNAKIVSNGGNWAQNQHTGPQSFTVYTEDDEVLTFGGTVDSTLDADGVRYRWLLSRRADPRGNHIDYFYTKAGGFAHLDRVEYGGVVGSTTTHDKVVTFVYSGDREDAPTQYRWGQQFVLDRRLDEIVVSIAGGGTLVRRYELGYQWNATTHRSTLASVRECAPSSTGVACRRPKVFSYLEAGAGFDISPFVIDVIRPGSIGASEPWQRVALDANGDGRTDFAFPCGARASWSSESYWVLALAPSYEPVQTSVPCTDASMFGARQRAVAADFDADGKDDLLLLDYNTNWRIMRSTGEDFQLENTGVWKHGNTATLSSFLFPAMNEAKRRIWDAGTYVGDVNGDGLPDVIQREVGSDCWPIPNEYCVFNFNLYVNIGGTFAPAMGISELDGRLLEDSDGFFMLDWDGDGSDELMYNDVSQVEVGTWSWAETQWAFLEVTTGPSGPSFSTVPAQQQLPSGGWNVLQGSRDFTVFDYNGDGIPDLLSGDSLYVGNGKGYVAAPFDIVERETSVSSSWEPRRHDTSSARSIVVDWNADGLDDVLVPVWENQPLGAEVVTLELAQDPELCAPMPACYIWVNRTPTTDYREYVLLESTGAGFIARDAQLDVPCAPGQSVCDPADGYNGVHATRDLDADGMMDVVFPTGSSRWMHRASTDPRTGVAAEGLPGTLAFVGNAITIESPSGGGNVGTSVRIEVEPEASIRYSPLREATGTNQVLAGGWDRDAVYFRSDASCTYPCRPLVAPRNYVVAETHLGEASVDHRATRYRYQDGFHDLHGRGFLGFRSVLLQQTPLNEPLESNVLLGGHRYGETWQRLTSDPTTFDSFLRDYPGAGRVESSIKFGTGNCGSDPTLPSGTWAETESFDFSIQGRGATWAPLETSVVRYGFECLPGGIYIDLGIGWTSPVEELLELSTPDHISNVEYTQHDLFGNPLRYTTSEEAVGIDPAPTTSVVTSTYDNDETNWRIGQLRSIEFQETNDHGTATRQFTYRYDPTTGLLEEYERGKVNEPLVYQRTHLSYDYLGNQTRTETFDAQGHRLRQSLTVFDARGDFPTSFTNGLGHTTQLQYEPRFGRLTSERSPTGAQGWAVYDGLGSLRRTQSSAGGWIRAWSSKRDVGGRPVVARHRQVSDGTLAAIDLDERDRPLAKYRVGLRGRTFHDRVEYDARGRVASVSRTAPESTSPLHWYRYQYDRRGRIQSSKDPNGAEQVVFRRANRAWSTDGRGHTQHVTFDARGRLVEQDDAMGKVSTRTYGPFGNLVRTDTYGDVTTQTFDEYGRRKDVDEPNSGLTRFTYDNLDQLIRVTDADGDIVSTCYDGLGRRTHELRGSDGHAEWNYGPSGRSAMMSSERSSEGFERTYRYDALGRLDFVTTEVADASGATESFGNARSFDAFGRMDRFESGYLVSGAAGAIDRNKPFVSTLVRFDAYGHATQIVDATDDSVLWDWTEAGPENEIAAAGLGNGVESRWTYHPETGRLDDVMALPPAGAPGSALQHLSYGWDANGNLQNQVDGRTGVSETFTYDPLNRLVGTSSEFINDGYSYSSSGNLVTKPGVTGMKYDDATRPHALTEADGHVYTYDRTGNQESRPSPMGPLSIAYTTFNKPRTVQSSSGTVEYAYDARHRRFRKEGPSGVKLYVDERFERTESPSGQVEHRFVIEGPTGPFLVVEFVGTGVGVVPQRYYLHRDVRGSLDVVTDSAGLVVHRRSYTPFGKPRNPDWRVPTASAPVSRDFVLGFTGHEDEEDLGWVNMKGRIYDPHIGRFLNPDLLVGDPTDDQNFNRYAYVLNNPMTLVDPEGYQAQGGDGESPYDVVVWGERLAPPGITQIGPVYAQICRNCLPGPKQGGRPGQIHVDDKGRKWKLIEHKNGNWLAESYEGEIDTGDAAEFLEELRSLAESLGWLPAESEGGQSDDPRMTPTQAAVSVAGLVNLEPGSSPEGSPTGLPGGGLGLVDPGETGQQIYVAATVISVVSGLKAAGTAVAGFFKAAKKTLVGGGRKVLGRVGRLVGRTGCFVAGTMLATPAGGVTIEQVSVGDRVVTSTGDSSTQVNGSWRAVSLVLENGEEGMVIEVLRSAHWLAAEKVDGPGDRLFVELPEINVAGWARVTAIRTAQPASGRGRVVLMTVKRTSNDVYELLFEGTTEPIHGTGGHPLYSLDQHDWVRIEQLQPGDRLQTAKGVVTVASTRRLPGVRAVYNLEVEDDHEYFVGPQEVRAHNSGARNCGREVLRALRLEAVKLSGKSFNSGKKSLEKAGFELIETTKTGRQVFAHPESAGRVYFDSGKALAPGQKPHWHIVDGAGNKVSRTGRIVDSSEGAAHIPAG
ncbi:MAG: RHS repeat-associated core domain-containing protein [Deltaproteobacteria bacterium]